MDATLDIIQKITPDLNLPLNVKTFIIPTHKHKNLIQACLSFAHFDFPDDPLVSLYLQNLHQQDGITLYAYTILLNYKTVILLLVILCPDLQHLIKNIMSLVALDSEVQPSDMEAFKINTLWIVQYAKAIREEIIASINNPETAPLALAKLQSFLLSVREATIQQQSLQIQRAEAALGNIKSGMNYIYLARMYLVSYFPNATEILQLLQHGPHPYLPKQILVTNYRKTEEKFISWAEWSEYIHYLPADFQDTTVGPLINLKRLLYEVHILPSPMVKKLLPSTYSHSKISLHVPPGLNEKQVLLHQLICLTLANNWEMLWRKMGWNRQGEMIKRLDFYKKYELKDPINVVSALDWVKLLFCN